MRDQQTFFDFAAEVGLTKHIGGIEATEKLLELCHVNEDKIVLDVGCGAGATPCYIAKRFNCKVVGIDILEAMVERSKERAMREGLVDRVEFRVGDAQRIPFEENSFDIVITESVTSFPDDKQKAVNEYVRVTKPGGFVGLNETTWLKTPTPPEYIAWVSQDFAGTPMPLACDEWMALLKNTGLKAISARTYDIDVKDETKGIFRRYGFIGMLGIYRRMLSLYLRNPSYRDFLQTLRKGGLAPPNINQYLGYGIYVGQKP
jgi:ubiquinone/menaquinone biosynthesis C-methylase UbiE